MARTLPGVKEAESTLSKKVFGVSIFLLVIIFLAIIVWGKKWTWLNKKLIKYKWYADLSSQTQVTGTGS